MFMALALLLLCTTYSRIVFRYCFCAQRELEVAREQIGQLAEENSTLSQELQWHQSVRVETEEVKDAV